MRDGRTETVDGNRHAITKGKKEGSNLDVLQERTRNRKQYRKKREEKKENERETERKKKT